MDVWDPLMIAGLAAERRVIVFDYRGVGGSTDEPSVPMTIDLLAQDTAGLIKALHLRRADVLGWSLGGYVAQRLVELHPERVRRLVLVSTDPGGPNAVLASADILALDARGHDRPSEHRRDLVPPLPTRPARAAGQAWLERYLSQPGCCESVSEDVGLRQLDAETGWQTGPGAWDDLVRDPPSDLDPARGVGHRCSSGERTADRGADLERQAGHLRGRRTRTPDAGAELVAGMVNGFL